MTHTLEAVRNFVRHGSLFAKANWLVETNSAVLQKVGRLEKTTLFVAACCRWPHTIDSRRNLQVVAATIVDWNEAQEAVSRHRVAPLVDQAVKDMPDVPAGFRKWVKQEARKVAFLSMQLTHECIKIDGAFKVAGLRPMHFKGPVLGQIAFGSITLKHSGDLDIFVQAADIGKAVSILETLGYRVPGQDSLTSAYKIAAVVRNFKDLSLQNPNGTLVELHWRFGNDSFLFASLENRLERQSVMIANAGPFETFSSVQMLEYLCVYGAHHHWWRLKWLTDLAAFLEQLPHEERELIIAKVSEGPACDAVAQALQLCVTLLGTQYAPHLSSRAEALYQHSLKRINERLETPKSLRWDIKFISDLMIKRHLYATPWKVICALKSHLYSQGDVMAIPLPNYLNGLYPFLRFPSLLLRRFRG